MNGSSQYMSGGFCTRCGTAASPNDRFCKNCGAELGAKMPHPESPPAPEATGYGGPAHAEAAPFGAPEHVTTEPTAPEQPATAQFAPATPAYGYVPPPPPPGLPYAAVDTTPYAGFWLRVLATIIDWVIITVVQFPFAMIMEVMLRAMGAAVGMPELGLVIVTTSTGLMFGLLLGWLYNALMESSSRQATLGKMVVNIMVTDEQGQRISFARATGRYFAEILSSLILFIGYIMVAFTARKQGLHDMLAGTLVVKGRPADREQSGAR